MKYINGETIDRIHNNRHRPNSLDYLQIPQQSFIFFKSEGLLFTCWQSCQIDKNIF